MKLLFLESSGLCHWHFSFKFFTIRCLHKQAEIYKKQAHFYFEKAALYKGEKRDEFNELIITGKRYQRAEGRLKKLIEKYR